MCLVEDSQIELYKANNQVARSGRRQCHFPASFPLSSLSLVAAQGKCVRISQENTGRKMQSRKKKSRISQSIVATVVNLFLFSLRRKKTFKCLMTVDLT